jgi:hypothetical protein
MWIKTSVAVLGILGALAAATPAPTLAQGVYIGPGGVGVESAALVGVSAVTGTTTTPTNAATDALAVGQSRFTGMMAA